MTRKHTPQRVGDDATTAAPRLSRETSPSGGPYEPYRSTLLPPGRVRELSRLRPLKVVFDTLGCWACIVGCWLAVAAWSNLWSVLLAIPVIGSRFYALFIIGHDGLHRRLFRRRRTNDLFNDIFIMGPIGAITRLNNRNHLSHHSHLATTADPDRHKYGCFNKSSRGMLFAYLTGASSLLRSVRNVFFRGRVVTREELGGSFEREGYQLRDLAILGGWQIGLIVLLTWGIGWWAYPVLWLAPVYLFTFLADNLRSFLEHGRPEPDAAADSRRMLTFTNNWLERLFLAPMNMNFHAAHHLWPSIPYYNLPQADRELRQAYQLMDGSLEWRGSYLGALWQYVRALPIPGCGPAADGAPLGSKSANVEGRG